MFYMETLNLLTNLSNVLVISFKSLAVCETLSIDAVCSSTEADTSSVEAADSCAITSKESLCKL